MKKITSLFLIILLITGLCSCSLPSSNRENLSGLWEFDYSDEDDFNSYGVTAEFAADNIHLKNSFTKSELDAYYEKDENNIYITGMTVNGKTITDLETTPYTLTDDKLLWNTEELGIGNIIMRRTDKKSIIGIWEYDGASDSNQNFGGTVAMNISNDRIYFMIDYNNIDYTRKLYADYERDKSNIYINKLYSYGEAVENINYPIILPCGLKQDNLWIDMTNFDNLGEVVFNRAL